MGSDLAAGVPFYGAQPSPADALKIKAAINAQYAELDKRITDGWPAFDAALTEAQVPHEGHIYRGANHGFHNDTTPRYDEAAARSLGKTRWTGSISTCAERLRTPRPPVPMNSTISPRRSVKAPRTLIKRAVRGFRHGPMMKLMRAVGIT
jgi:hypothetical protein